MKTFRLGLKNIFNFEATIMKTKLFRSYIAVFLLLLLSGSKAFGYHNFLHDHDSQIIECEVCEKALVDQFSPLDTSLDQPEIGKITNIYHQDIIESYTSETHTVELSSVLFSRPPPFLN